MLLFPLACVQVVTQLIPAVKELDYVAVVISDYLDPSPEIPFSRACALGSLRLMKRVWHAPELVHAYGPGRWTLSISLRNDRHYHSANFELGVVEAAKHGNLDMLRWIMQHFAGCKVPHKTLEMAARGGHRDILQFLLEYYQGRHFSSADPRTRHIVVIRHGGVMTAAAAAGHSNLVIWMTVIKYFHPYDKKVVLREIALRGNMKLFIKLWTKWKREQPNLRPPRLDFAAEGGNLGLVQ